MRERRPIDLTKASVRFGSLADLFSNFSLMSGFGGKAVIHSYQPPPPNCPIRTDLPSIPSLPDNVGSLLVDEQGYDV